MPASAPSAWFDSTTCDDDVEEGAPTAPDASGSGVHGEDAELDLRLTVKTTASSLESFLEVTGAPGGERMLVSTVDAWCRPADFTRFVAAAMDRPPRATVLAVTPFVADEKPLWVDLDADQGRRAWPRTG